MKPNPLKPALPRSDRGTPSDPMDLRIRVAWLYYIEGLTQEQVAQRLGISRIKALRLLAQSREEGLIQININAKAAAQVDLERRLGKHLKIDDVTVVPAPSDPSQVATVVGHAAGVYLSEQVHDGLQVGIGWGATLQACLRSVAWRDVKGAAFLSLLGGLTHATSMNPAAVAWRLADFYKVECYQITAPVYVSAPDLADILWAQPDLADLRMRARRLDLALISVGSMEADATIFRQNMLPEADRLSLIEAGAVGDLQCYFVDDHGRMIDHDANRRAMAISPDDLRDVAHVAIASGGAIKAPAIRAGILSSRARTLITDETAAEALLALPPL